MIFGQSHKYRIDQKMIIIRLIGGLGNQLFQYALGRKLAYKHNSDLKLDISGFAHSSSRIETQRSYRLNLFNIKASIARTEEIQKLRGWELDRIPLISPLLLRLCHPPSTYIREHSQRFDPHILDLTNNIYLDGYWQSEDYFIDIRDILLKEITRKDVSYDDNRGYLEQITSSSSISIHIRRGDYATDPKTNRYHGVCSLEYYRKAVEYMTEHEDDPHFFIFSDDLKWARENLTFIQDAEYISHNEKDSEHLDLWLMSQCKHQIIANSSFSWWGAWLNQNNEKIVIAPKQWLLDDQINTDDIIPKSWTKI
jgi:hypothetical protein